MEGANLESPYAKELTAQNVIQHLVKKNNVVVLDYNLYHTSLTRIRCLNLTNMISECRNIYRYCRDQFYVSFDSIKLATIDLIDKDSDICKFSCSLELGHIFIDGVLDVRSLDQAYHE